MLNHIAKLPDPITAVWCNILALSVFCCIKNITRSSVIAVTADRTACRSMTG